MQTVFSTVALVAGLALAGPASAAQPVDFQGWLSSALEHNMEFPRSLQQSHANGVATVRFNIDRGRPADVTVVKGSGNLAIDRAALRAIRTLDLPVDAPAGPHFAVMRFGTEISPADTSAGEQGMAEEVGHARLALRDLSQRDRHAGTGGTLPRAAAID